MDATEHARWSDSLERYVFVNYTHLLTEAEGHAWQYFMNIDKMRMDRAVPLPDEVLQEYVRATQDEKLAASRDAAIKKLIEDYPDQFYVSVTYRILRDHPNKVRLVLCPKCLNLCGTPKAELCLRCGHSWHPKKTRSRWVRWKPESRGS